MKGPLDGPRLRRPRALCGIDRRTLVCLLLSGAAGAALADVGLPVNAANAWEGPVSALDSVHRTIAELAALYDEAGPRKIGLAVKAAEKAMHAIFTEFSRMPAAYARDAKAVYAQLLTMSATVANQVGDHAAGVRTGQLAASLAYEVGDTQTAGHAWGVVSAAQRNCKKERAALYTAQRARSHAGSSPASVMALLEEAFSAAAMGHTRAVLDAVAAAESGHAQLTADRWGTPGYPFGTFHPAGLKAYAGSALVRVGLYSEAAPRLGEAADLLAGTGGLKLAYVWMGQARALLGTGDADSAHDLAAVAVAQAETRPAAWVVREVRHLNRHSRGAFADLVEQTSPWGFAARQR
jgi:hypothetical protein